jgi:hypothetical protein
MSAMTDLAEADVRRRNSLSIKKAFGTYFAVGFAICVLVPDRLAAALPLVPELGGALGGWIPAIGRIPSVTPFPETARLFMLIMWAGLPLVAYRLAKSWTFNPRLFELRRWDQWFVVAAAAGVALFSGFFVFSFLDVSQARIVESGGRGGWLMQAATQHSIVFGLVMSFLFCVVAATSGIAVRLAFEVLSRRRPAGRGE